MFSAADAIGGGLFHFRLRGAMGEEYTIFNSSGSLESFFGCVELRKEGMSVLTKRTIDSGIKSICHMIVSRVLC